jgi:glycosyltransferase EpsE
LHVTIDHIPTSKRLIKTVTFFHPTVLAYKYIFEKVNGYTVSKRTVFGQDYDLWFKFYAAGFVGHNINKSLYKYRINKISSKNKIRFVIKNEINLFFTKCRGFKLLRFPHYAYFLAINYHIYSLSIALWLSLKGRSR